MKEVLKKIFLLLTNSLTKKNLEIKSHFSAQSIKYNWENVFNGKPQIEYPLTDIIKIFLERNNKLSEYILFHDFEKQEIDFINKYVESGDFVLDIGANIGLHALYASVAVGTDGKVYAFEPAPETFHMLQKNIDLNAFQNIESYQLGFSNKNEKLSLYTSREYNAWNSFAYTQSVDSEMFSGNIEVGVYPLSNWLKSHVKDPEKISFIKIDVEGWEKYVIEGAEEFLLYNAPVILIEFDDGNTHRAGYHAVDTYDMLSSLGFTLYEFSDNKYIQSKRKLYYHSQNLIAVKENSIFGNRFLALIKNQVGTY